MFLIVLSRNYRMVSKKSKGEVKENKKTIFILILKTKINLFWSSFFCLWKKRQLKKN
jgi:hypothetical protein